MRVVRAPNSRWERIKMKRSRWPLDDQLTAIGLPWMALTSLICCFVTTVQGRPIPHHLPQLSSVFPQGSGPGQTTQATALGEFLDRAETILFLGSGIDGRIVKSQPTALVVEIRVSPEAELGPH